MTVAYVCTMAGASACTVPRRARLRARFRISRLRRRLAMNSWSGGPLPPASGGGVSRMTTAATFRRSIAHGFFLEYDRGTESRRQYGAKFRAYYRYRVSGQAQRDYD